MKTKRTSTIAITDRARPRVRTLASFLCFGVLSSILVASALYIASSASSDNKVANATRSAKAVTHNESVTEARSRSLATRWLAPLSPLPPLSPDTVATYEVVAGACTNTLKDSFNLGEDVCAKASADLIGTRLSIDGTDGTVADLVDITTDPQELIFTLPNTTTSVVNGDVVDNRGIWRATVHSSADFGGRATAFFSVADPNNAAADLIIFSDSTATAPVSPGNPTGFSVYLLNAGPDAAAAVHVTQNVPPNMTFNSATAGSGTAFTCSQSGGVVDCAPAGNLASGATSAFTINYDVSPSAPTAILTSEIDISSTTTDPHPTSNVSESKVEIRAPGDTSSTCALACPLNRTVGANTSQNNQPGAIVNFAGDIEPSGDCGSVTSSPASGTFFPVGTTTVNVSSSTGGGSCSFTITVTQVAAPTISCAADQTAQAPSGSSEASVTVNPPTATGNNVQVSGVRNDNRSLSDPYPVGTTTITWTATECNNPPDCDDPNARFAQCTQKIIVTSPDAPTITCPTDRTFTAPSGSCQITVLSEDIGLPSTTGPNVTVTNERSDGLNLTAPYPAGDTFITWTATNNIGSASCTQKIHVNAVDNQAPALTVPPDVNATTSTCTAVLDDELGVATATDNCTSSVNIVRTGVPPNFIFPTGTTIITYTAADAAGNTTVGTQRVTVLESPAIPPTITAPANVSVNTGTGATVCGAVVSDATLGTATASDNCPGVTVARTGVPAGNLFPVGDTFVTYTATDKSGNTATATQKVTVVDNTPPVVTPPGPVTLYTGAGATSCGVTVSNLNATLGTGSATDNCPGVGAVTRSGVPSGNNFPVGTTTLTYSATDAHGNPGSATQVVTVVDNTPPVISCPSNIVLEPTCPSGAIATYTAPVGTDNCPGATTARTAGGASGTVFPIGTTTVTYTVTDASNNSTSCSFTVTVKTPAAVIQDLINRVQAMIDQGVLNQANGQGLLNKLNSALSALNSGNTPGACDNLDGFIDKVQGYILHGTLTSAQGQPLIDSAKHAQNGLGCKPVTCT